MSRTDVHRPYPVQLADPFNRHLLYRFQIWPWEVALTSYRNLACGCQVCTGQPWRKAARRRERAWTRRQLRLLRATARHQRELFEPEPFPRSF